MREATLLYHSGHRAGMPGIAQRLGDSVRTGADHAQHGARGRRWRTRLATWTMWGFDVFSATVHSGDCRPSATTCANMLQVNVAKAVGIPHTPREKEALEREVWRAESFSRGVQIAAVAGLGQVPDHASEPLCGPRLQCPRMLGHVVATVP